MKKIFIILLISFTCFTIKSQTNKAENLIQSGLTDAELQKAVDSYVRMIETKTYKANKKITDQIVQKLNQKITAREMGEDSEWEKWIAKNLRKTKFTTIKEANTLRNLGLQLTKKQVEENTELYQMIAKATIEQRHIILEPERAGRIKF